jgi:hypothetical protein
MIRIDQWIDLLAAWYMIPLRAMAPLSCIISVDMFMQKNVIEVTKLSSLSDAEDSESAYLIVMSSTSRNLTVVA